MHEWPILLVAVASDGRFDDPVRRANDRSQLGAGVDVQLVIDVHEMGGYGPFADAEPVCNLPVRKAVDDVTDDLALALAQFLIEDRFHLSVRNEMGNPGPIRVILVPNQRPQLIRLVLREEIYVVKLPRMLDGHGHQRLFIVRGEHFATGGTGNSQRVSLNLLRHTGTIFPTFLVVAIHANFSDAHGAPAGDGVSVRHLSRTVFGRSPRPSLEPKYIQTRSCREW